MKKKKKVVAIGGGNGPATTLNALKKFGGQVELSAVVSMSDSGGSSGELRREFKTLPPGDIMRAILSLSPYDFVTLKQIFYKNRFSAAGRLNRHNLGNLFLVLSAQYDGDYLAAVRALEQAVEAVGHVYPSTLELNDLVAELDNGEIVRTEEKIDRPEYDRKRRIRKVWQEPSPLAYHEAVKVLERADYIFLGPGSLHTSIIATLLPNGIQEAIARSTAKIVFIPGSIYAADGETGPTTLSEFVLTLQAYLPRKIDLVVHNVHPLNKEEKEKYKKREWVVFPADKEKIPEYEVWSREYEKPVGLFDYDRLADIFREIII
ncbi:MAG TPA: uridine diphosphate-N-acetylglucosamine-binding protein YvcK [Patescibacteria group bacterium]|nr:uridine diphosphate-N-acetylglucosamine-binding protein YvcK [Patescibacteria group bacterium]